MRFVNEMNEPYQGSETCQRPVSGDCTLGTLPDGDLLDAWSRDQHPPALAELVRRYSVMVLSVCRRRCRSNADADDAFQTTFLYLARNGQKIRNPERLAGWLHRVAQRAAVATTKSSKRETEPMVEPPANPDDPLDRLTQRHEAIVLDEELADLPEHYRAALVMHVYDERPLQYLAEHFGTTIGSIRGRLQRGKQMLARRLRHRGVVPVVAFAAANAWTTSANAAADASESFIDATPGNGTLPDPPVDPALLQSLLSQGVPLMPSIYTAASAVVVSSLLAIALATAANTNGQNEEQPNSGSQTIALAAAETGQTVGSSPQLTATIVNPQEQKKTVGQSGLGGGIGGSGMEGGGMTSSGAGGGGLGGGMGFVPAGQKVWAEVPVIPKPSSKVAEQVNAALDAESAFAISSTLNELPAKISEAAGIPVLLDDRGIEFAKIEPANQQVQYEQDNVPLRSAMRAMLHPFGLKAVVEDEGLVITADPAALVHQGIGTSRWINVDVEAAKRIATKLQADCQLEFIEIPLADALQRISEEYDLPMIVEARAMEEVGIAADTPVTITISDVKLENALAIMLQQLELAITIRGETLVVTTPEEEEQHLLHRIYWLESTGIAAGDYSTIMHLITSTISPNSWSDVGGPSTLSPLGSSRPALLISTTYKVHQSIDNLFQTLRETHFGVDPILEQVEIPAGQFQGGQFGGGFGGQGGGGQGGGFGGQGGGGQGGGGFF